MEPYNENTTKLQVSPKLRQDLAAAATWAKFIAIAGMVTSAISVVDNISRGEKLAYVSGFISLGLAILIYTYLLLFANKVKKGLATNNQSGFDEGLIDLRTYFKIISLLLIICLIIALIVFVFVILLGSRSSGT